MRKCFCDCFCRCLCDASPSAHGFKTSQITADMMRVDKSKRKGPISVAVRAAPARETMGDAGKPRDQPAAGGPQAQAQAPPARSATQAPAKASTAAPARSATTAPGSGSGGGGLAAAAADGGDPNPDGSVPVAIPGQADSS